MPTKRLPDRPDLSHLKNQGKDLLAAFSACSADALQRIREFHPRFSGVSDEKIAAAAFTLSDAYLTIAREYGFGSWARLRRQLDATERRKLDLPFIERIDDAPFREAVHLLDDGDVEALHRHLGLHPGLARGRVVFEGGNYFREPALLEFVAENPIRNEVMPPNAVDIAREILDAGAKDDRRIVDSTLALVCSGRVSRECGLQVPLIDLLCDYGAEPKAGMPTRKRGITRSHSPHNSGTRRSSACCSTRERIRIDSTQCSVTRTLRPFTRPRLRGTRRSCGC